MIIYGADRQQPQIYAEDFLKHGIGSVCVWENEEYLNAYREAGLCVYLAVGGFGIGERDESHQAQDVYGKPQIWFSSGCPNDEEIREENLKEIERKCSESGIEGVIIDGARFSSPCSAEDIRSFFTCFCPRCMQKARRLGFDAEGMRRGVQMLLEFLQGEEREILPYLGDVAAWFEFRRICAVEHLRDFARTVHAHHLKAGAFLFSPSMAWSVGQNYGDLKGDMDLFLPMIYPAYKQEQGPACLNHELSRAAQMLRASGRISERKAVETVLKPLGIREGAYTCAGEILQGLPREVAAAETARAKRMVGSSGKIAPILDLNDEKIAESIAQARTGGADEIALFMYEREIYERYKDQLI